MRFASIDGTGKGVPGGDYCCAHQQHGVLVFILIIFIYPQD